MGDSQDIPWKRIAVEAAAIVSSILLAFSIDAWWSNWQAQNAVRENLSSLRVELLDNLGEIDFESNYRKAVIASVERLNGIGVDATTLEPAEIDKLIGHLMWFGRADVSLGALESTLQSSVFTEIGDRELQRSLAGLPELYDHVQLFELRDSEYTVNRLIRYIEANGSFNQIVNSEFTGRPGTGEMQSDVRFREAALRNHTELLESDEFLGILTMVHGNHSDVLMMYERLRSKLEHAIGLIDRHSV